MTVTYFAARNTNDNSASDETRAMCSVDIAKGDDLDTVKAALVAYIEREIEWLMTEMVTASSLRRAADLMEALPAVRAIEFDQEPKWSRENVVAAGLQWSIVRVER